MIRYRPRAVLMLFLVLHLTACTSWQSVSLDAISPAELIEEDRPDRVRVTGGGVLELEVVSPSVEGDQLVGADGVSAIEWADRAIEAFNHDVLRIDFKYDGVRSRSITLNPIGQRYVDLLSKVRESIDGAHGLRNLKKTLSWFEA